MNPKLPRLAANVGLLLIVNILWGAQSTAYKLVGGDISPIATSFLIFLIAVPSIVPLYLWQRRTGQMPTIPTEQRSLFRWENAVRFLILGVVASCTMIFMASGMTKTTAANGALLSLTIPIITAVLAALFLHEHMTLARWGSLFVAMLGVLMLSVQAPESAAQKGVTIDWHNLNLVNKDLMLGNLLVMLGCLGSCLFNIFSKSLLSRFSLVEILIFGYSLALVYDAAMLAVYEPSSLATLFNHSLRTWMGLLIIGAVANGLAMALWLFLLTRMDVSQASVSIYLLPFFGVAQATIFLHEQITLPMIIGGAITLGATILTVSLDNMNQRRLAETATEQ